MTQHIPGTWKAIDIEIYEVDDLGNPGSFLAMARDQRVAARLADMHNSMLGALKEIEAFPYVGAQASQKITGIARAAIAKAEGTKR